MIRAYGSVLMTLERFNLGKAGGPNAICITSNLTPPSECHSVRDLILIYWLHWPIGKVINLGLTEFVPIRFSFLSFKQLFSILAVFGQNNTDSEFTCWDVLPIMIHEWTLLYQSGESLTVGSWNLPTPSNLIQLNLSQVLSGLLAFLSCAL